MEEQPLTFKDLKGVGQHRLLLIVASGPSLQEIPDQDWRRLKACEYLDTMSINEPYQPVWPTDYWLYIDDEIMHKHGHHQQGYKGLTLCGKGGNYIPPAAATPDNWMRIPVTALPGWKAEPAPKFHLGKSSTYVATQAATYLGYDQILIAGMDMCQVQDQCYWNGHPDPQDVERRVKEFQGDAEVWTKAVNEWMPTEVRNKIVVCSTHNPHSFVNWLQRLDQHKMVEFILAYKS